MKNSTIFSMLLVCLMLLTTVPLGVGMTTSGDRSGDTSTAAEPTGSNITVDQHNMTDAELAALMANIGVRNDSQNYNQIIDGHGTGLAPPTLEQWYEIQNTTPVVDNVVKNSTAGPNSLAMSLQDIAPSAPSSYDISTQSYFPAVGNQLSSPSCAAWAMTYYAYGYEEARDNGWTDASTGNAAHLMSPAWTYNRINGGLGAGSFMDENGNVIIDNGVASMSTMPFVANDYISWGSEAAYREAINNRASSVAYVSYSSSAPTTTWTNIKNLVSANIPVTFAIDAKMFGNNQLNDNIDMSWRKRDIYCNTCQWWRSHISMAK